MARRQGQLAEDQLADQRQLQPVIMAFEDENAEDTTSKLECKVDFNRKDVVLWFRILEGNMKARGIKSQDSKVVVLITNMPEDVQNACKRLLCSDSPGPTPYKDLMNHILKEYGPKETDSLTKAEALKLEGKPSKLGRELIEVVQSCSEPNCKTATKFVKAYWLRQLPSPLRARLADEPLDIANPEALFERADAIYQQLGETGTLGVSAAGKEASSGGAASSEGAAAAVVGRQQPMKRQSKQRGGAQGPKNKQPRLQGGVCIQHSRFGTEAYECLFPERCSMAHQVIPKPNKQ